jgi:hypothetical protein
LLEEERWQQGQDDDRTREFLIVALAEIEWMAKVNHTVAFFCFLQITSKANVAVKCQCPVYPRTHVLPSSHRLHDDICEAGPEARLYVIDGPGR